MARRDRTEICPSQVIIAYEALAHRHYEKCTYFDYSPSYSKQVQVPRVLASSASSRVMPLSKLELELAGQNQPLNII
jgi:hypothetical protein